MDSNVATPEEYINTDTKSNSNSSTLSSNFVLVDHFETDEETESTRQFVKVELSTSESQPVRSSGSGEDENEVELISFAQTTTPSPSMQVYSEQKQTLAQGETPEVGELQVEITKPGKGKTQLTKSCRTFAINSIGIYTKCSLLFLPTGMSGNAIVNRKYQKSISLSQALIFLLIMKLLL